jgi:hypothetical protein
MMVFWDVRPCSMVKYMPTFWRNLLPLSSGFYTDESCSFLHITPHDITAVPINNQFIVIKCWTLLSKGFCIPRFTNRQQYEKYKGGSRLTWTLLFFMMWAPEK